MNAINDGDILSIRGYEVRVRIKHDIDGGLPWKNCDGCGDIRVTRDQRTKNAGEQPFGSCYLFNFRTTTEEAKRDGWGLGPEETAALTTKLGHASSRNEIVAEAVQRQYEYLKAWANDEWQYHGYVATLMKRNDDGDLEETEFEDSCCGFEYWLYDDTKNRYFFDEIRGAADSLVCAAEKEVGRVCYWNERDVMTV